MFSATGMTRFGRAWLSFQLRKEGDSGSNKEGKEGFIVSLSHCCHVF